MKWLRHAVINYLTKNLLRAVTVDEVLLVSSKEWLINKRKLGKEEMISLREEAESLKQSLLYKLLLKEVKYQATLQRLDQAKTVDDIIFGKAMAYNLSLISNFIENITKL